MSIWVQAFRGWYGSSSTKNADLFCFSTTVSQCITLILVGEDGLPAHVLGLCSNQWGDGTLDWNGRHSLEVVAMACPQILFTPSLSVCLAARESGKYSLYFEWSFFFSFLFFGQVASGILGHWAQAFALGAWSLNHWTTREVLKDKNFFFWLHCTVCGILVPRPGIKHTPSALAGWSLNHWTPEKYPFWMILG